MIKFDSRKIIAGSVSELRRLGRRWRILGRWLLVVGWVTMPVQSQDELDRDLVVEMSPYEVSAASVEFEGWKKLISPNFIVYTDAASTEVRPAIEKLEMVFMATQVTLGRRPLVHAPITVVLPSSRSDWKKIRSKGKVKWKVGATSFDELAYFVILEYDWQDEGVDLLYAITSNLNFELLGVKGAFPIRRGLTYFFETAELIDGALNIGGANRRVSFLKNERWFDWERFFAIHPSSPEFVRDSYDVHRFSAQSAIFVHYMLMQEDPQVKEQLWEWNALLHAGNKPTEVLFQSVFGMNWSELRKTMKDYLSKGSFTTRLYRFPPESMKFVVTELDIKAQEMRELFVLVQINNQKIEDSELALDSLLKKGLKTEELRAMLVGACLSWKRPEAALKVLRDMVASGNQFPEVYTAAAELIFESQPLEGFPPVELLDEVASLLTIALKEEPLWADAIEGMTQVLATGVAVGDEQVQEIKQLCLRLQGNGQTDGALVSLAFASWRNGDEARAKRVCDLLAGSLFTRRPAKLFAERIVQAIDAGESPEQMLTDLKRKK